MIKQANINRRCYIIRADSISIRVEHSISVDRVASDHTWQFIVAKVAQIRREQIGRVEYKTRLGYTVGPGRRVEYKRG